jgi:hypothetical protein
MFRYDFSDADLLKIFYAEIFPCKELAKWLTYGAGSYNKGMNF